MKPSLIRIYLLRRGWVFEGSEEHDGYACIMWSHPGVAEKFPQNQALLIERMKNPQVRERMKAKEGKVNRAKG